MREPYALGGWVVYCRKPFYCRKPCVLGGLYIVWSLDIVCWVGYCLDRLWTFGACVLVCGVFEVLPEMERGTCMVGWPG